MAAHSRHIQAMDVIDRHTLACNNARLPGGRTPLLIAGAQVGYVDPSVAPMLPSLGAMPSAAGLALPAERLQSVARALAETGHFKWRDEAFDVRADPDGPVLGQVDRGALPALGIQAVGVHLNALVQRQDGWWLWVARRASTKPLDPGKFDHLVAGGVPAGLTPLQALLKEADEEAGLPAPFLSNARHVATIDYAMARSEGLRRDRLHCYDVVLPESFAPEPRDGEVESFKLWPIGTVLDRVRQTDDFKFNVNLVLIDLFRRRGLLPLLG